MGHSVDYTPRKVMENAAQVSTGEWHYMCITKDNRLWGWGDNSKGQLGLGDYEDLTLPTLIMSDVKNVYAIDGQTFAIKTDMSLWGWGYSEYGSFNDLLFCKEKYSNKPVHLFDDVACVSAGKGTIMVVTNDGDLWGWGRNTGLIFTEEQYQPCLNPVPLMKDVISIEMIKPPYASSSCYVTSRNGDLYILGWDAYGPGSRDLSDYVPKKLMQSVRKAYPSSLYSMMVLEDGRLFCWGNNAFGRCGTGKSSPEVIRKPKVVMHDVVDAGAGHNHAMALQSNGDLWIWGGDYGIYNPELTDFKGTYRFRTDC